jgi:hypothetical protein
VQNEPEAKDIQSGNTYYSSRKRNLKVRGTDTELVFDEFNTVLVLGLHKPVYLKIRDAQEQTPQRTG